MSKNTAIAWVSVFHHFARISLARLLAYESFGSGVVVLRASSVFFHCFLVSAFCSGLLLLVLLVFRPWGPPQRGAR